MPFREDYPDLEATLPPATSRLAGLAAIASKWHFPELCTYLFIVIFFTWSEIAITASLYCPDDLWVTILVSCSSKVLATYLSLYALMRYFREGSTHRDSWGAIRSGYIGSDCITRFFPQGLRIMAAFCFFWTVGAVEKLVWCQYFSKQKRAMRRAN
jgi:hypothetical protein